MKTYAILIATALFALNPAIAAPQVGKAAPDFTATDSDGKTVKLSDYKGKFVVLEWLNHGCPFVKKHYESKNMQNLQKDATGKGAVWLSIVSSAPGKQGNMSPADTNTKKKEIGSEATAILIDEKGEMGKLYGAKTTPEMYIINPEGVLVYAGAIDDKSGTDAAEVAGAKNYVKEALNEALARKPVTVPQTASYGCSVKY